MIVTFEELASLRGKVAMVDGCFDPLHRGHVEYFQAAAELGAPVLCNLAPDTYLRAKHPPLLPEGDRAAVIDAFSAIAYTHLNLGRTTADVLAELRPRWYVKGKDWEGRLPEVEVEVCDAYGIEIAFVDTVRGSSTKLLNDYSERTQ